MIREILLEELLERVVVNPAGRPFARIKELIVEPAGDEYLVTHYLLGPLSRWGDVLTFLAELPPLRALGFEEPKHGFRKVPWSWLDLSDPVRPRMRAPARS